MLCDKTANRRRRRRHHHHQQQRRQQRQQLVGLNSRVSTAHFILQLPQVTSWLCLFLVFTSFHHIICRLGTGQQTDAIGCFLSALSSFKSRLLPGPVQIRNDAILSWKMLWIQPGADIAKHAFAAHKGSQR